MYRIISIPRIATQHSATQQSSQSSVDDTANTITKKHTHTHTHTIVGVTFCELIKPEPNSFASASTSKNTSQPTAQQGTRIIKSSQLGLICYRAIKT